MRSAGTIRDKFHARRFADFLLTRGIHTRLDGGSEGFTVWVLEEERLPEVRAELPRFLAEPDDPRYNVAREAEALRAQARRVLTELLADHLRPEPPLDRQLGHHRGRVRRRVHPQVRQQVAGLDPAGRGLRVDGDHRRVRPLQQRFTPRVAAGELVADGREIGFGGRDHGRAQPSIIDLRLSSPKRPVRSDRWHARALESRA